MNQVVSSGILTSFCIHCILLLARRLPLSALDSWLKLETLSFIACIKCDQLLPVAYQEARRGHGPRDQHHAPLGLAAMDPIVFNCRPDLGFDLKNKKKYFPRSARNNYGDISVEKEQLHCNCSSRTECYLHLLLTP